MPQGGDGKGRRDYTPRPKKLTTEAAKSRFIELLQDGVQIEPALEKIGYSRKSYYHWRTVDPQFKARADQARQLRAKTSEVRRGERLGFAEWREKYLNLSTPWHQLQWVDLLEGRPPRDLHPSQTHVPGKRNRLLVNCPPNHGKSMALTVDYVTYRLCLDPSYRVLLISAGQYLASRFLSGIKDRLTSPDFIELQKAYAPDGGWEATADSWAETRIVFGQAVRESGLRAVHEKDATVEALGLGSKVYGRRADLAIVDDGVDHTNVSGHAKQLSWLQNMTETRLDAAGKVLVIGTRVASVDLYSELMKPTNYANQQVPWTYLASPAILEEAQDPKNHVTLWPYQDHPWVHPDNLEWDECLCENTASCTAGVEIDGRQQYPRWDGVHLEMGPRSATNNTNWALIYQQKSVAEDATFPEHAVQNCVNGMRHLGLLKAGVSGHPHRGMHGMYVLAGLDPSIKGFAGIVVYAVDKETKKRYVLQVYNMKAPTKAQLEQKMKDVTDEFGVHEWRVEKTGLLQFFTQDAALRLWFSARGIKFTEHHTGSNKWDAGFGVSSMASLFGEYDKSYDDPNGAWRTITEPLIELPRPNLDGIKALIHQLITWTPELDPNKVPCDLVMALWFAEIGAREHLGYGRGNVTPIFGGRSKFISPRSTARTTTITLADYRA